MTDSEVLWGSLRVLGGFYGTSMGCFMRFCGGVLGVLWGFYRGFVQVLWGFYEGSINVLWGSLMVLGAFYESSMGF